MNNQNRFKKIKHQAYIKSDLSEIMKHYKKTKISKALNKLKEKNSTKENKMSNSTDTLEK